MNDVQLFVFLFYGRYGGYPPSYGGYHGFVPHSAYGGYGYQPFGYGGFGGYAPYGYNGLVLYSAKISEYNWWAKWNQHLSIIRFYRPYYG